MEGTYLVLERMSKDGKGVSRGDGARDVVTGHCGWVGSMLLTPSYALFFSGSRALEYHPLPTLCRYVVIPYLNAHWPSWEQQAN